MGKWDIFDKWSQSSPRYNRGKNKYYWDYNHGVIDFNYFVHVLRQEGHDIEYIPTYKEIPGITTTDVQPITTIHTKRLYDLAKPDHEMFNYTLFKDNDTIIAESCTGTGKSHAVLKEHVPRYLEDNPHMKLLTLTN